MSAHNRLAELVRLRLGDTTTPRQLVEHLISLEVLHPNKVRDYIIVHRFFQMMRDPEEKTASDIEMELAVEYEVSQRYVRELRTRGFRKRKVRDYKKRK